MDASTQVRRQYEITMDGWIGCRAVFDRGAGAFARHAPGCSARCARKRSSSGFRPQCGDGSVRWHFRYDATKWRETCPAVQSEPAMQRVLRRKLTINDGARANGETPVAR